MHAQLNINMKIERTEKEPISKEDIAKCIAILEQLVTKTTEIFDIEKE